MLNATLLTSPNRFSVWAASSKGVQCTKCADLEQTAYAQNIIQAFGLHSYILQNPMILLADSEGPDQTAHPRT